MSTYLNIDAIELYSVPLDKLETNSKTVLAKVTLSDGTVKPLRLLVSLAGSDADVSIMTTDDDNFTLEEFNTLGLDKSKIGMIKISTTDLKNNDSVFYLDPEGINNAAKAVSNGEYTYTEDLLWKNNIEWAGSNVLFELEYSNFEVPVALSAPTKSYFNAYKYTQDIIGIGNNKRIETPSADFVNNLNISNGSHYYKGILPSVSQLKIVYDKYSEIDNIINAKYGDFKGISTLFGIGSSNQFHIQSSIQVNDSSIWVLNGNDGTFISEEKTNSSAKTLAGPFFRRY